MEHLQGEVDSSFEVPDAGVEFEREPLEYQQPPSCAGWARRSDASPRRSGPRPLPQQPSTAPPPASGRSVPPGAGFGQRRPVLPGPKSRRHGETGFDQPADLAPYSADIDAELRRSVDRPDRADSRHPQQGEPKWVDGDPEELWRHDGHRNRVPATSRLTRWRGSS